MLRQAVVIALGVCAFAATGHAAEIKANQEPAQLDIRAAGEHSIRVTLKPLSVEPEFPFTPALAEREYPAPAIRLRQITEAVKAKVGALNVEVQPSPLTIVVTTANGQPIQKIVFEDNGSLSFAIGGQPVLGMGEGGPPLPRGNFRTLPIEFDRRGRLEDMRPRWQSDAYGSRNPVAMMVGTAGWGLFIATPWGQVDLRDAERGVFTPWQPPDPAAGAKGGKGRQTYTAQVQGRPPVSSIVPGVIDLFVFDAHEPAHLMKDISLISGAAVMPPKWALGYMQSHRELVDKNLSSEALILNVVDTFREKKIPVDAVIYLGTGFTPTGWNTRQPSFTFNPRVFERDPKQVLADLHAKNVNVIVHMVPPQRDRLPSLQGTIPAKDGETLDASHVQNYWQQHVDLQNSGIDAWWPDEGDWFNLFERIKRHQLYYQGPLSTRPNERPWSLHRNGHLGVAQWGGWVWSGDTQSTWKTLEGQVAVGINHSLSLSPFWGSDIGGFYTSSELTGELYARWFQFAAFCPSFRSHGRIWRPPATGTTGGPARKSPGGKTITRKVDLDTMPFYARAGAIIPFDPLRQYMTQPVTEPTTIRVYSGADGEFRWYEDDGASQEYLQSKFARTRLTWNDAAQRLTIERDPISGTLEPTARKLVVELVPSGKKVEVNYDGRRAEIGI